MDHNVEPNALLLQVMAHDLLSPLTAVKWQVELLQRPHLDPRKQVEYLESIADSTTLGITLTKHAHVAASVLLGKYKSTDDEVVLLSSVLKAAVRDLTLQYERHSLMLTIAIAEEGVEKRVDRELTSLLVWAIAKFFLTCAPPHITVSFEGNSTQSDNDVRSYTLSVRAPDMSNCAEYVALFNSHTAQHQYDQTYVFTQLIHAIAPLIGVSLTAHSEGSTLSIEAVFPGAG